MGASFEKNVLETNSRTLRKYDLILTSMHHDIACMKLVAGRLDITTISFQSMAPLDENFTHWSINHWLCLGRIICDEFINISALT